MAQPRSGMDGRAGEAGADLISSGKKVLLGQLTEELQDLYSAELQLVKALPKMEKAAHNPDLKRAFADHLEETKNQVTRLEQVMELIAERPKAKTCKAMMGLIAEGKTRISEHAKKDAVGADLSLIAIAQKVEHYEISGYGTARALAEQLGTIEVTRLLENTLQEEKNTDMLLSEITAPMVYLESDPDAIIMEERITSVF